MFELVGNPIWVWVGVLSVYPNFNSGDKKARWKNSIKSKVVNCDFIKCGNIGNFGGCCEVEFAYNNYLGGNQWWLWELEPMENIRVYNNTYRNQRNLPGWESIEFWSTLRAHAKDVRIYDNDIQDIRAGRNGIFAVTFRDPLFPDFWGSSENISIVGNTFSSGETTEICNGIWAAFYAKCALCKK